MNEKKSTLLRTILVILGIFVIGGFGSLIIQRYVAPYLVTKPVFKHFGFLHVSAPIVVTRTEQVRVNENVNLRTLIKQLSPQVVTIVGGRGNLGASFVESVRGSGVVVSSDGLIATDESLVADKSNNYWALTSDGSVHALRVVANDPTSNLALAKIDANGLSPVRFGASSGLETGEMVALLSAGDSAQASTFVSAFVTKASLDSSAAAIPAEQTRAEFSLDGQPIVGAGVFNLSGELVGLGLVSGVTLSSEAVKSAGDSYFARQAITRSYVGLSYKPVSQASARLLGSEVPSGVVVTNIVPSSPAQKAGVQQGDIITKVNDQQVTATQPFSIFVSRSQPANVLKLTYIRGGKQSEASVTLGELK